MVQKTGVNNNVYPRSRAHFDSLLIICKLKRLPGCVWCYGCEGVGSFAKKLISTKGF